MSIKVISKRDKTFEIIKSAVDKLVDTVKPTYGPANNKVIISKFTHAMPIDDGVQIARDFELEDDNEYAVVKLVKETAIKTNDRVGDGTTGAMIMLQAIINEVAKRSTMSGRQVEIELKRGLEEVVDQLRKQSKPIKTKEELKKVAMISFDNEEVAEMIADLYSQLGEDGVITIAKSESMETYSELTDGLKLNKGYISPYMIINQDRMETVLEKPYILITDYRLAEATDILPIMDKMAKQNKRELVVICQNMEQNALSTAVVNKLQGKFLTVAIASPSGAVNKTVLMEDLAKLTGARMISEGKGDKLEDIEIEDLGRAERFICRKDESIIVNPKGDETEVKLMASQIKAAMENERKDSVKKQLEYRLGIYTGSLAVIKVGASTENEQKALKYKVEDAVHATKAAFKSGVVCGAGLALARLKTSSKILNEALSYPNQQILDNMGVVDLELKKTEAYNVVTGEKGDFMEVGVMDPVDVLIAGVESAVSIASILVTSSGMIVEHMDKDKK